MHSFCSLVHHVTGEAQLRGLLLHVCSQLRCKVRSFCLLVHHVTGGCLLPCSGCMSVGHPLPCRSRWLHTRPRLSSMRC